MNTYYIQSGAIESKYDAESEAEALNLYAQDAGYTDYAEVVSQFGEVDEITSENEEADMIIEYQGKDQNWADETTVYWFDLTGTDAGTGVELEDCYGIAESGGTDQVLNSDCAPMTEGDSETIAVRNNITVTDEMRIEG